MDKKLCNICGQEIEFDSYGRHYSYVNCYVCRTIPNLFGPLKQSAEKRNLHFDLTPKSLQAWWSTTPDQCFYCGVTIDEYLEIRDFVIAYDGQNPEIIKFKRFYRVNRHRAIGRMTIDRMNNNQGYTLENIAKSCWICNSLKGSFFDSKHIRIIAPDIVRKLKTHISH